MGHFVEAEALKRVCRKAASATVHITKAGAGDMFIVACTTGPCDASEAAKEVYTVIAETLQSERMEIIHERIFASLSIEAPVMEARNNVLSYFNRISEGPTTYIQGAPPWGEGLAGIVIHAVASENVWTIFDNGTSCGRGWKKNGSTWLMLQNINGYEGRPSEAEPRMLQVKRMIERSDRILRENGSSYGGVLRTWFYLSHILDWYAEFNNIRNEKYGEFGIMPGPRDMKLLLPASTGIGGDSPSGAAATMDLLAITGDANHPEVTQLTNTAQLDAFRYGSAFSRGALIEDQGLSLLEISGTAAIDERGKSLFIGDSRSQIGCTFDKIEALLTRGGSMNMGNICTATAFVKRPEDAAVFQEVARARGLGDLPVVCIVADVCREELMFEMDAEAVLKNEVDENRRQREKL